MENDIQQETVGAAHPTSNSPKLF